MGKLNSKFAMAALVAGMSLSAASTQVVFADSHGKGKSECSSCSGKDSCDGGEGCKCEHDCKDKSKCEGYSESRGKEGSKKK